MKNTNLKIVGTLLLTLIMGSCSDDDSRTPLNPDLAEQPTQEEETQPLIGAVYVMTNGDGQISGNVQGPNTIVTYGRFADGTLDPNVGTFPTGGNGGDFDGGEGLDPLISAYALTKTPDNQQLLAVNAGSNTITSFNINPETFTLEIAGTPQPTGAVGPNSIAFFPSTTGPAETKGIVYVTNITRPEFLDLGEPQQQGTVTGFWLTNSGELLAIENSTRDLANRPSAVQISPNGEWLVVASINSGSATLASANEDEVVVYNLNATTGLLSASQISGGTSTLRGNADNRNLPSAIGFQIVGDNYVVVTEAREFQPNGMPPAFPALQDGSVSTWQIQSDGSLTPVNLDVRSGEGNTGRTACWLDFTNDGNTFFVSNAIEAGIASYSFNNGEIELLDQNAALGTGTGNAVGADAFARTEGWIDMWISDDGAFLYQLYGLDGTVGVFRINGNTLELIREVKSGKLPDNNTQGIVAI